VVKRNVTHITNMQTLKQAYSPISTFYASFLRRTGKHMKVTGMRNATARHGGAESSAPDISNQRQATSFAPLRRAARMRRGRAKGWRGLSAGRAARPRPRQPASEGAARRGLVAGRGQEEAGLEGRAWRPRALLFTPHLTSLCLLSLSLLSVALLQQTYLAASLHSLLTLLRFFSWHNL